MYTKTNGLETQSKPKTTCCVYHMLWHGLCTGSCDSGYFLLISVSPSRVSIVPQISSDILSSKTSSTSLMSPSF